MELQEICRTCVKVSSNEEKLVSAHIKIFLNDENILTVSEMIKNITTVEVGG